MSHRSRSITKKLLNVVVVYCAIGMSLAIFIAAFLQYRSEIASEEQELRYVENSLKPSLELALWNFDTEQISSLAKGLLTSKHIRSLTVSDGPNVLVEQGKPAQSSNLNCRQFPLRHTEGGPPVELGRLKVCIDRKQAQLEAYWSLLRLGTTLAAALLFVALAIYLSFRELVTRHLLKIAEFLRVHQVADKFTPALELGRRRDSGEDELDKVVGSINNLYEKSARYQEELVSLKEEAQRANDLKSTFVATVSHELRTPLNSILGMTEMMEGEPLNDECRNYLRASKKAAEHLRNLIEDILDLSNIEAGQFTIENNAVDLREALEFCGAMVQKPVATGGNRLEVSVAEDFPGWIMGDRNRIMQVALNLLTNANKFTKNGVIIVSAETSETSYFIRVQDTGVGISKEDVNKVFNRFWKGKTQPGGKGAGIGLTISKLLIEQMGGHLSVTSTEGVGSIFLAELPLRIATSTLSGERAPGPEHDAVKRILVVEDCIENQELMRAFFKQTGYQVEFANDGAEGLGLFKQKSTTAGEKFDVVYMDLMMPVMDGFDATTAIRLFENESALPHAAIVAVTAFSDKDSLRKALKCGCNGYIKKPFSKSTLFSDIAGRTKGA